MSVRVYLKSGSEHIVAQVRINGASIDRRSSTHVLPLYVLVIPALLLLVQGTHEEIPGCARRI